MPRLGVKCKAYYNTGTQISPTWAELSFINDWTVDPTWDVADALSRNSRVKGGVKTLMGLKCTGTFLQPAVGETGDTVYSTFIDALNSDTVLDLLILNGPSTTNGVRGYRFDGQITTGQTDQGTGAVLYDQVELIPTPTANSPKSVLVTSGAPVYTALVP